MTHKLKTDTLLQDLGHLERGVREQALRALVTIGEPVVELLIDHLRYPYSRGRPLAVRALGSIGDARALPILRDLLHDMDDVVRGMAAWALGRIGDVSVVPDLLQASRDSKMSVRNKATEALRQLGHAPETVSGVDERMIRQHIAALRSRPAFAREQAARALIAAGPPAVPALLTALSEPEPWARKAAADTLGAIGDPQARVALQAVMNGDPAAMVRQAARLALEALAEPD